MRCFSLLWEKKISEESTKINRLCGAVKAELQTYRAELQTKPSLSSPLFFLFYFVLQPGGAERVDSQTNRLGLNPGCTATAWVIWVTYKPSQSFSLPIYTTKENNTLWDLRLNMVLHVKNKLLGSTWILIIAFSFAYLSHKAGLFKPLHYLFC